MVDNICRFIYKRDLYKINSIFYLIIEFSCNVFDILNVTSMYRRN